MGAGRRGGGAGAGGGGGREREELISTRRYFKHMSDALQCSHLFSLGF